MNPYKANTPRWEAYERAGKDAQMRTLFENGKSMKKSRIGDNGGPLKVVKQICDRFGWEYPVAIPGGSHLLFTFATIPPEVCKVLIDELNIENNRDRSKVMAAIADLKRGAWHMTHQGIAFNRSGKMGDGQHRCQASVDSGIPLPTHIAFNVEDDAIKGVDLNKTRSALQVSKMFDLDMDKRSISSVRWMLNSAQQHTQMSPEQVGLLCEILDDGLSFAKSCVNKHVKHVTMSPLYGAIGRAAYHEDRDRLRDFARILVTGDPAGVANYSAALRLRTTLMTTVHNGGGMLMRAFELMEVSIVKFCRGEKVQQLRVPDSHESPYPLPQAIADQVAFVLGK